jgi:hypothetical protein
MCHHPQFFHWDGVSWTLLLPRLAWNHDPSDLSHPWLREWAVSSWSTYEGSIKFTFIFIWCLSPSGLSLPN